ENSASRLSDLLPRIHFIAVRTLRAALPLAPIQSQSFIVGCESERQRAVAVNARCDASYLRCGRKESRIRPWHNTPALYINRNLVSQCGNREFHAALDRFTRPELVPCAFWYHNPTRWLSREQRRNHHTIADHV